MYQNHENILEACDIHSPHILPTDTPLSRASAVAYEKRPYIGLTVLSKYLGTIERMTIKTSIPSEASIRPSSYSQKLRPDNHQEHGPRQRRTHHRHDPTPHFLKRCTKIHREAQRIDSGGRS